MLEVLGLEKRVAYSAWEQGPGREGERAGGRDIQFDTNSILSEERERERKGGGGGPLQRSRSQRHHISIMEAMTDRQVCVCVCVVLEVCVDGERWWLLLLLHQWNFQSNFRHRQAIPILASCRREKGKTFQSRGCLQLVVYTHEKKKEMCNYSKIYLSLFLPYFRSFITQALPCRPSPGKKSRKVFLPAHKRLSFFPSSTRRTLFSLSAVVGLAALSSNFFACHPLHHKSPGPDLSNRSNRNGAFSAFSSSFFPPLSFYFRSNQWQK